MCVRAKSNTGPLILAENLRDDIHTQFTTDVHIYYLLKNMESVRVWVCEVNGEISVF